jgi:hypothetical protein
MRGMLHYTHADCAVVVNRQFDHHLVLHTETDRFNRSRQGGMAFTITA